MIYQSKDAKTTKTFDALVSSTGQTLDWLAQLETHIPNKGKQMVRYYGFYSNKLRGLRKKAGTHDQVPALIVSEASPKEFRENWARLIQKIQNKIIFFQRRRRPTIDNKFEGVNKKLLKDCLKQSGNHQGP